MKKKCSDQIVEMIQDAGVKRVYAITGDSLNAINDAVRRNGNVEWIHVRHEESGAFAATAEALLTGNLACCAGSSGPGHVHLINGLYDANRAGAPVVVIASTCGSQEFGTQFFQETNTIKLFDDCSVYNQVATTPHQLPRMLQSAMQNAISSRAVGVVAVPGDLAFKEAEDSTSSHQCFKTHQVVVPSDAELTKLAKLLNSVDKVCFYCGCGVRNAHDELVEAAKKLNAPVANTYKGKPFVMYDNPNAVGLTGLLGYPSGYQAMHEAEVLVMLGTDFPYDTFFPEKDVIIVQIDIDPNRIGRRAKVKMGLCGDIKATLTKLLPMLEQKTDDSYLKRQLKCYEASVRHFKELASTKGIKGKIQPEYAAYLIDKYAADDAIFTADTGMCNVWSARYFTANGKRQMIASFNHGSMANAMPMAMGAQLAYPGRQVVAFCGDGGLTMLMGDLETISQYKLPVKLFVFENNALGMVKLEMEVAGLPDWETNLPDPKFAILAKSMGFTGFDVNDPDQLEDVVKQALATEGPVLVSIHTDPNALSMPPKIEYPQVKGFIEAMAKIALNGRFGEIADTIRENWREAF